MGCDVQFDAPVDEISFDCEVVDLPLVGYDPFLNELMVNACEAAIVARGSQVSSFRAVVENAIAPLLPHAEAQAKTVARKLGMSERTFARRLATEGLTFGRILDDLRRDLAVRYLGEAGLPISRIAWLLGSSSRVLSVMPAAAGLARARSHIELPRRRQGQGWQPRDEPTKFAGLIGHSGGRRPGHDLLYRCRSPANCPATTRGAWRRAANVPSEPTEPRRGAPRASSMDMTQALRDLSVPDLDRWGRNCPRAAIAAGVHGCRQRGWPLNAGFWRQ